MRKAFTPLLVMIIIAIIAAIKLVGWNTEKDKQIAELERQVIELKNSASTGATMLDKNIKCGTLMSEIEKKLDSRAKEFPNLGKFSLGGIFYSPLKDACLWIQLTSTYAKDGSPLERRALYQFGDDLGASEPLIGCEKMLDDTRGVNTCEKWDTELKTLKGESASGTLKL